MTRQPNTTIRIRKLERSSAVEAAYAVMAELRPHLDPARFVALVSDMRAEGYALAGLFEDGQLKVVAGYRIQTMLVRGRSLYVDDLVTTAAARGTGLGKQMIDWLLREAKRRKCVEFHLDSGVQRFAAHAFYFGRGLHISAYHFAIALDRAGRA